MPSNEDVAANRMSDFVEVEDLGPVRFIHLNRPDVRNAINVRMLLALRRAVRAAEDEPTVRAVVFAGRGPAFSAGADVKEWAEMQAGRNPHPDHDWVGEAVQLVQEVMRLPKPTIAMIDGAAVGAGLDMALACDFRIVSTRAKFICAYTWVGYPPDCGGSWLLPRLIGVEAAKLFVYTGDTWDAVKAKDAGMVSEVVAPEDLASRVTAMAQKLASGPTVAIGLAKQLIDAAHRRSFPEQLAEEQRAGKICARTDDHAEGLAAANEKRMPVFKGR
ncbi:MAG: enoyl-CoA hydratase-related protein [Hyphomicrobiales bacterium]